MPLRECVGMQAQKLKKELAEVQAKMDTSNDGPMPPKATPSNRIDGGDLRRETLDFVGKFLVSVSMCECLASTHARHLPCLLS